MILIEEKDRRFYIAESKIPQAGLGVFAAEELKKDDWMDVIGVIVKNGSIADKCTHYASSYKFSARPLGNDNSRLIVPMGYAGIVNHAPNQDMQNAALDLVTPKEMRKKLRFSENTEGVVYRFLRDIHKDEEILGHYGNNWDAAFKWAEKNTKIVDELKSDWETFLDLDLYNMGILRGN